MCVSCRCLGICRLTTGTVAIGSCYSSIGIEQTPLKSGKVVALAAYVCISNMMHVQQSLIQVLQQTNY